MARMDAILAVVKVTADELRKRLQPLAEEVVTLARKADAEQRTDRVVETLIRLLGNANEVLDSIRNQEAAPGELLGALADIVGQIAAGLDLAHGDAKPCGCDKCVQSSEGSESDAELGSKPQNAEISGTTLWAAPAGTKLS